MHNASDNKLKPGKGAAIVKSRLRALTQTADLREAGIAFEKGLIPYIPAEREVAGKEA